MNRRNFLLGCLAAGIAPAIVRAESLMKLPRQGVYYAPDASFGGYLGRGGDLIGPTGGRLIAFWASVNDPGEWVQIARGLVPVDVWHHATITYRANEVSPGGVLVATMREVGS